LNERSESRSPKIGALNTLRRINPHDNSFLRTEEDKFILVTMTTVLCFLLFQRESKEGHVMMKIGKL